MDGKELEKTDKEDGPSGQELHAVEMWDLAFVSRPWRNFRGLPFVWYS